MKIAAVDQRNFHGSAPKFLRGVQAAEPTSKDYQAVLLFHACRPCEHTLVPVTIISSTVIFSISTSGRHLEMRKDLILQSPGFLPLPALRERAVFPETRRCRRSNSFRIRNQCPKLATAF